MVDLRLARNYKNLSILEQKEIYQNWAETYDREHLDDRFKFEEERWAEQDIKRPNYWGGFRIIPERFEFWQGRPNRLHDRLCYRRIKEDWLIERLSP